MERDEVLSIIGKHRKVLEELGVKSLELFGSVARNEANAESDVDFLVEFSKPVGLFQFSRVRLYLEEILGCSVDLGTHKALRQHLRETILKDIIRVF